ncbi:MAG: hypothetical protein HYX36_17235 [Rhizobiales bacterium]|nr:hypothetical protein [Hyphomicrobiales bacterium]
MTPLRIAVVVLFLSTGAATAQDQNQSLMHGMMGMNHNAMMGTGVPQEPGQSAFAAIQEIAEILQSDPATDWSKVSLEALRQHLIDMNNVTLYAVVTDRPVQGGMTFVVSGEGSVRDSIQRMVMAHAATMNGVDGWKLIAAKTSEGADLTANPPANVPVDEVRGLGFIGLLTLGMHHQTHHLMIATGMSPHS